MRQLLSVWPLDGVEIDLTRTQIDVYGGRWDWTGTSTDTGEPLMQQFGDDAPLPLSEVYATYGPLIAAPAPITHADRRAAITACPAEPTTEDQQTASTATPSTFAALLGRLRRRAA